MKKSKVYFDQYPIFIDEQFANEIKDELDEFVIRCKMFSYSVRIVSKGENIISIVVEKDGNLFCELCVVKNNQMYDVFERKQYIFQFLYSKRSDWFDNILEEYKEDLIEGNKQIIVFQSPKVMLDLLKLINEFVMNI
jgi:hypothetical protein